MNGKPIQAFFTILWLTLGAAASAAGPDDGMGWRLTRLDLEVTVLPGEARIRVEGVMHAELEAPQSLGPTIFINSNTANMRFTRVEVDDAASVEINQRMPDRPSPRLAHVRFTEPFVRGAALEIAFAYESSGGSGQFGVSEEAAIASWVDTWHPLLLFDSNRESLSSRSKSTGTITLHLPADWRGAAEGELVSRDATDSGVVERWRCETPVARSFAAGGFMMAEEQAGDRTIRVYRLSSTGVSPERLAHTIAEVLDSLEGRFGPYPYDSYAIIEVPGGLGSFGAASLQGMILARRHWFDYAGGSLPLFSHEMAHGWWGNLVGTRGAGGILCSESLAQYSATLAIESVLGWDAATEFMRFSREDYIENQCARGYFELWREGYDLEMSQLRSGGFHHTLSDAKGHWVFHMLRRRVGDEVFFATLRSLLDEYADRQMALDDVRSAFIAAAPDAELERFFRQWLDQTGAPVLAVEWRPSGDGTISVQVEQQQPGEPYHLDLDLELQFGDDRRVTRTVDLRERRQSFEFAVEGRPTQVVADPDHRLLIWTPEYGPNPLTYEPSTDLTEAELEAYVGDYDVEDVGVIRVFIRDGRLFSRLLPGDTAIPAHHVGEHQFRVNGLNVTFRLEEGKAVGFEAEGGGRTRVGRRKQDD